MMRNRIGGLLPILAVGLIVLAAAIFLPQARWIIAAIAALVVAVAVALSLGSEVGIVISLLFIVLAGVAGFRGCRQLNEGLPAATPPATPVYPEAQPTWPAAPPNTTSAPTVAPPQGEHPSGFGAPGCPVYRVAGGDTLMGISRRLGEGRVPWRYLAEWNNLADPDKIRVGQELVTCPPQGWAPAGTG